ncbi:MAG: hypothetical protein IT460_07070 [Planctomycetes bacterium]|nr:hypothetical protein [Planctomycetota bacterium]
MPTPARPRLAPPFAVVVALVAGLVGLAACSTPKRKPVDTVGLHRDTPRAAFEYLRAMVAAEQPEAEWRVFSPAFKRRLSEQVGRTVDIGDYVQARSTIATNARKEIQMLLESEVVEEQASSDKVATLRVRSGKAQARARFVRLTTWELKLVGEGEPVAEFIPSASDAIAISPTGNVEMRLVPSESTAAFLRDVPQDRIRGFDIQSYWYLDDFSGIEGAVLSGLRGDRAGEGEPAPRGGGRLPPLPPPGGDPNAPSPGTPDGFGSPDGGGVGSPDGAGVGSPDGR